MDVRPQVFFKPLFLALLVVAAFESRAESVRARSYSEVRAALANAEVVIYDLDSTLVRSERMFGSDAWFDREWADNMRKGMSRSEARKAAEALSDRIQDSLLYEAVEPQIAEMIREQQSREQIVMIHTARRAPQVAAAQRALREIGVDITVTSPRVATALDGILYVDGMLVANGEKKGPVLERFLRALNLKPRSIAFVDDKLHNLVSVIDVLRGVTPNYLAVHYAGAEEYNSKFRPEVSSFQKAEFLAGRPIPSDGEALRAVRSGGLCRAIFGG